MCVSLFDRGEHMHTVTTSLPVSGDSWAAAHSGATFMLTGVLGKRKHQLGTELRTKAWSGLDGRRTSQGEGRGAEVLADQNEEKEKSVGWWAGLL